MYELRGNIVDLINRTIFPGVVEVSNGIISRIRRDEKCPDLYIMPGFIDAHVHIESSMLTPYEFSRKALVHGTVATVSDPHEIANVCGLEGIDYMIRSAKKSPLKFRFGAPSCVPATSFETSGAELTSDHIRKLMRNDDIHYLSEVMNYPGVLNRDPDVMSKISSAVELNKPVDGHAPGLRGKDAEKYISAGISTDHECFTKEEALDKLSFGMKIIIREGSAARNFEALHELISEYPDSVMFCSDDKHPDELENGHINKLASRAVNKGHDLMNVLQCSILNPMKHYNINTGLLRVNDPADLIVVKDLTGFEVLQTWIDGKLVAENGRSNLVSIDQEVINNFNCREKKPSDFRYPDRSGGNMDVIIAIDGQLITESINLDLPVQDGHVLPDTASDVLKIAVVNRYEDAEPAVAFIRGFGLKKGAMASSVAHDSHNIVVVGADDNSICRAVNRVIENSGGLSAVNGDEEGILPLPVAGLMSDRPCDEVSRTYKSLDRMVKEMGSGLRAPYMTLSFMSLLVIPELKLSDRGLFDGRLFRLLSQE